MASKARLEVAVNSMWKLNKRRGAQSKSESEKATTDEMATTTEHAKFE